MRQAFTGCGTALVTPFTRGGALDEAGVRRLARRQIDAGIHFLVPCGTTGETPTLTRRRAAARRRDRRRRSEGPGARCSRARGATTRTRSSRRRSRWRAPAPTASCRSRRTTTSPRRKGCSSITRRSPTRCRCRSSSTTCPGRTGVNVDVATIVRLSAVAEHRRRQGSVGQRHADVRDLPGGPGRLPRAVGRRCADAAGDVGGRPRDRVGGLERGAGRDVAHGGARRGRGFRRGAPAAPRAACR